MTRKTLRYYIASIWVRTQKNVLLGILRVHDKSRRRALNVAQNYADETKRKGLRARVTVRKAQEPRT
jgi:hypothetical protein